MEIGIFETVFHRPSLDATLDAVRDHGLSAVQFDLASAGLPSLPDHLEPEDVTRIRAAFAAHQITMAAVSGTFNIIHPNAHERRDGMRRLGILAEACPALGTSVITRQPITALPSMQSDRAPMQTRVSHLALAAVERPAAGAGPRSRRLAWPRAAAAPLRRTSPACAPRSRRRPAHPA